MKKYLYIITTILCLNANSLYSQLLYTENFDNLTVGNLGTDYTGNTPGQNGWYTFSLETQTNSFFTIVNETNRGKVLDLSTGLTHSEALIALKNNLHNLIANRLPGNDVLSFEIDYFTGSIQPANSTGNVAEIRLSSIGDPLAPTSQSEPLTHAVILKNNGTFLPGGVVDRDGTLPFNTWIKISIYLDYPNKKVYHHIPYLNEVFVGDFLQNKSSASLIDDYPLSNILIFVTVKNDPNDPKIYTRNRYDDIKITALNAVPPDVITLSTNEQLSSKFNIYPNPANNIVNITNSENMSIQQVIVYDINGKQLKTQNYDSSQEIKLNVDNLSSGTYMLHIKSDSGTAIKKLIKK